MYTSHPQALPGSIWLKDGLPLSLKNRSEEEHIEAPDNWRQQLKKGLD